MQERNEESQAKRNWEKQMLQDPATGEIPEGIQYKERAFLKSLITSSSKRYRGGTWEQRGPWNVGGRTRSMVIDIKNENHLIAGSVSGGIWESLDAGTTWTKRSLPNDHPGIMSITQDQSSGNEHIWYAVSGEIYGTSASAPGAFYLGDGAFRSLDNGSTWQSLASTAGATPNNFTSNFQGAWRIATGPNAGGLDAVYMACYGTIYRSVDTGNSWTAVLGAGNNSYFTDVAVSETGVVYASMSALGVFKGLYRSPDGINFTNITPTFLKGYNRTVIEINPNNENEVYFLSEVSCATCGGVATTNYQSDTEYVSLLKYTYLSGNGSLNGGQWDNLSQNLPVSSGNQFDKFNCQGGYDLCIRVQPGTNHIFIGGTNLYRSTNAFTSPFFTKQIGGYGVATALPFFGIYPNHHPDQHDVLFLPSNPNVMYSISDGGVKKTDNCLADNVVWQEKSLGYITSQVYTVNIDEKNAYDNRMFVGLQDNGNFLTLDNDPEQKWVLPVNGDGAYGHISPDGDFYVMSIQNARIVKIKVDERGNLVRRRRLDPSENRSNLYSFIHPFAVDPNDDNYLYLPQGRSLLRIDDLHDIELNNDYAEYNNWFRIPDSITTADYTNSGGANVQALISCISISQKPANVIYLGTNNREIWRMDNANSANPTLTLCNDFRLPVQGFVRDIAIDPDDAMKALVCYSNYNVTSLFYTDDGGANWKLAGGNLESPNNSSAAPPSIRSVAILKKPDGSKVYFAGTSVGLFSTDSLVASAQANNNVTNWVQESPNFIGANVVTDIKVRNSDGYVAVGTHGNGVFESMYTGFPKNNNTRSFLSMSTYPNPVTDKVNYSFSLDQQAVIAVDLVNAAGQKVIRESKGLHRKGNFTYSMNLSNMPNGVYILAIRDTEHDEAQTKKIYVNH